MKIFVVNCGSSSVKYQLFDMADESVLAKGALERVGTADAVLRHETGRGVCERQVDAADHAVGLRLILDVLVDPDVGVLGDMDEIDGVGHRVVHGGQEVSESVRVDEAVMDIIARNCDLAPLHNPANMAGIRAVTAAMPKVLQVAVFDTAFLATMPPIAHRFAVPESWYVEHHVRRYGFHGTSHRWVTLRTAELLGVAPGRVNLIIAHLGNGCSMTAIAAGKAVDHSMGMTPMDGLMMGSRCGSLDPGVVLYMLRRGMTAERIDHDLNGASGLLGVSGHSNDMRDILAAAEKGQPRPELAIELFVYRIVKHAASFYAILPGVDALVLTGGIGENSPPIRRRICDGLARLGVEIDRRRNDCTTGGAAGPVSAEGSRLPVWVVPTNEEVMIARDTRRIIADGWA